MNSRSDINELCEENKTCEIWRKHREAGKKVDSFKSYQKLDDDIAFIKKNGVDEFEKLQKIREYLLREMLEINEKSKLLHSILDEIALQKKYDLKLRK